MKMNIMQKTNSSRLLVFFQGWGMDQHIFSFPPDPNLDMILLYDYQDLNIPAQLPELLNSYEEIYLAGWSMGVWVLAQKFQQLNLAPKAVLAINGTLAPIHDTFGIPTTLFDATLAGLDLNGRDKFFRRMFTSQTEYEKFKPLAPQRDLKNQAVELSCLKDFILNNPQPDACIFTHIYVSQKDRIIPSAHQLTFWKTHSPVTIQALTGGHYPFFHWSNWQELLCQ